MRIDGDRLRSELLVPVGPYAAVDVVPTTGSTNADLRAAVTEGAGDRTVLIAEQQTAGMGRRGRTWVSPPGMGLYCSVLLRPREVPFAAVGSLALVAGLAVTDVTEQLGVPAVLKWPNDVLAGPEHEKCAGILAETTAADELAVVLGVGVNVLPSRTPLPTGPGGLPPTSLAQQGATTTDRTDVALLLLAALADREDAWRSAGGDLGRAGLIEDYRQRCATLGQQVKVMLPGERTVLGRAVDVDPTGQLLLDRTDGRRQQVFAGDVVHLRVV